MPDVRFYVATKDRAYGKWKRVSDHHDPDAAVAKAKTLKGFEVAVFVVGDTKDLMYWTSKYPKLVNKEVLRG